MQLVPINHHEEQHFGVFQYFSPSLAFNILSVLLYQINICKPEFISK